MCRTRRSRPTRSRCGRSINLAVAVANRRPAAARPMRREMSGDTMPKRSSRSTIDADNPDRAIGYAASGESKHSRRVSAAGGADPTYNRERQSWSRLDFMIDHETKCLLRLERRVMVERNPAKVTALTERMMQTRRMRDRMRAEQKGLVK
jgi:hypothetical protein